MTPSVFAFTLLALVGCLWFYVALCASQVSHLVRAWLALRDDPATAPPPSRFASLAYWAVADAFVALFWLLLLVLTLVTQHVLLPAPRV